MMRSKIFQIFIFLIPFLISALPSEVHAQVVLSDEPVVLRDGRGRAYVGTASIPLLNPDQYETSAFKVVLKKESTPIKKSDLVALPNGSWPDRDPETARLLAGNVLYHAEIARNFFANELNSDEVKHMEQVIIRLDITNEYNARGHFANDQYDPQFNNAVSVNGKTAHPLGNTLPWQREIWFRPKKEIPIADLLAHLPVDPDRQIIHQERKALYPSQLESGLSEVIYELSQSPFTAGNLCSAVARQGETFLIMESVFQTLRAITKISRPKQFYLDSALVPEIIDHEYSHIALSDYLMPDVSTPVIEGMADYFAAAIGNDPKLADKIKAYSTADSKNGKKKKPFKMEYEATGEAQSDFVLSLLWGLRHEFSPAFANRLVFEARRYLTTEGSDIRTGLLGALLKACDTVGEPGFAGRARLHQYFQSRGIEM